MSDTARVRIGALKRGCCYLVTPSLFFLGGCHSAFVDATLMNHSGAEVRLVELDYPSASFGTQTLEPGATFHYRFKVIGEGPVRLSWTDLQQKEHMFQGPALHEGLEGQLGVAITMTKPDWSSSLHEVER